jgi:predicted small secreted protein
MRKLLIGAVAAFAFGLGACGQGTGSDQSAADTLTRAQKDSIIAEMPIPGASAVGRAMDARDRANARTTAYDTIR